jgi:ketosteroid isomerase-like protein
VFEVTIDEVVKATDELVVESERLWGRGRESGVEVTMTIYAVYWFRAGKVVRRRVFETREEALAAAKQPPG